MAGRTTHRGSEESWSCTPLPWKLVFWTRGGLRGFDLLPGSLPAPHQAILRVVDLANALECAFRENSFGRDILRPGVGADEANEAAAERERDQGPARLRRIA